MEEVIFRIPISSQGSLAITPRPRGGDWLEDDIAALARSGIGVLVSMLREDEQGDLSAQQLSALTRGFPAGPSKQTRLLKLAKSLGLKPADALRDCVQTTTGFRNQDRNAR